MVSQLQLRSMGMKNGSGRVRRMQQRRAQQLQVESEREFERQSELAESQGEQLSSRIENLKADIRRLEVAETRGSMGEALEAASIKTGRQAELARIKELESKLGEGKYYTNLQDLLKSAKAKGKQVQIQTQIGFNPAIESSRIPSPDIPKGAKIESIKEGVITFSLPARKQEVITKRVLEPKIIRRDPFGIPIKADPFGIPIKQKEVRQIVSSTTGRRELTVAVDVGSGKMQDIHFVVVDGKIVSERIASSKFSYSPHFVERGRVGMSKEQVVRETLERTDRLARKEKVKEFQPPPLAISAAPTTTEYFKKSIGEKGVIKGTLDFIGSGTRRLIVRKQFERAARDPTFELYQPQATGRLGGFVAEVAPYFVPILGPALLIGGGVEELITKGGRERREERKIQLMGEPGEVVGRTEEGLPIIGTGLFGRPVKSEIVAEKITRVLPTAEVALGVLGLRVTTPTGIRTPRGKLEIRTKQEFLQKLKFEGTPKVKTAEGPTGELPPTIVKGGLTKRVEPFDSFTTTTGKIGKRYRFIQIKEPSGIVKGETILKSRLGRLGKEKRLEYTIDPETGLIKFKLFKGEKLVKTGEEAIKAPEFKLTEPIEAGIGVKIEKIQTLKDLIKLRVKGERKQFTQELVKVGKGPYTIKEGKQITKQLDIEKLKITPAKEFAIGGTKVGDATIELRAEMARKAAEISKKGAPDFFKIGDVELRVGSDMIGIRGTLYETPKFEREVLQRITSEGRFILQRDTLLRKLVRELDKPIPTRPIFLQTGLLPPRVRAPQLEVGIDIPLVKIKTPEFGQPSFFLPEVTTRVLPINIFGLIGIGSLKDRQVERLKVDEKQIEKLDIAPKIKTKEQEKFAEKFATSLVSRQIVQPKQVPREILQQKEILKQIQPSKQLLSQITDQVQLRRKLDFQQQPKKRLERIRDILPGFDLNFPQDVGVKEPAKDLLKKFTVFVTREGKDVKLEEEFVTLPSAKKGLKEELLGTLRAGGFIEEAGRKLKFEEVGLFGPEFRRSKVDPFKVIQKKEKRLGRKMETEEIQFFRKAKKSSSFL